MKIEELKPDSNFDVLKVRIISIDGPRMVQASGRNLQVWDFLVIDDTGSTKLTLWGKEGENYKVQQVITIENGWCKMFKDMKQISKGREGKIYPAEDDPSLPKKLQV